jgi:hypothetical protein
MFTSSCETRQEYASASRSHSGLRSGAAVQVGAASSSSSVDQVGSIHVLVPSRVYSYVDVEELVVVQCGMQSEARGYPSQSVVSPG